MFKYIILVLTIYSVQAHIIKYLNHHGHHLPLFHNLHSHSHFHNSNHLWNNPQNNVNTRKDIIVYYLPADSNNDLKSVASAQTSDQIVYYVPKVQDYYPKSFVNTQENHRISQSNVNIVPNLSEQQRKSSIDHGKQLLDNFFTGQQTFKRR